MFNFNKVLYKDIIAPSCVKEIAPGDITAAGKAESYWVEIGDISGPEEDTAAVFMQILQEIQPMRGC